MLVVNRVELVSFDEPLEMGKFHRNDTAGLEENFHPCDEIIQVGNMREHVIAKQQISLRALRDDFAGGGLTEETNKSRNAAFLLGLDDICRRVDAKDGNRFLNKVLEQITIIA